MDEVGLGKVLQRARKNSGLTQQELCQRAKLSYSTLAKIERGAIKSPSIFTVQSIAEALGVSLGELVGESRNTVAQTAKKRSKSGIRFVYFDINGCLVRFFHRAFSKISEDSGYAPDVIETTFWRYNDSICRGEMSLEKFNKILSKQLDMPGFDWLEYYFAAVEPIADMDELLRWANEYYYVGLLSNIMPGQIDMMIKRELIPNIPYSAVIDSSEVKAIKPESRIFEIAQSKTGLKPEEVLFVDDSRSNVMAGGKIGWKVLWFDDYRPKESIARVHGALEFEE